MITLYCTQIKLALGCVQLVEVYELFVKLKYILLQKSLDKMQTTMRRIVVFAVVSILVSLAILPYFDWKSRKTYNSFNFDLIYTSTKYKEEQLEISRHIESTYGIVSGVEFFVLVALFVAVFTKLSKLLDDTDLLNSALKEQRRELKLFWIIVFFGYGLRTIIQFMYGHYYLIFPREYTRWMLYYSSNPIMDVPNVLYVYWKHF